MVLETAKRCHSLWTALTSLSRAFVLLQLHRYSSRKLIYTQLNRLTLSRHQLSLLRNLPHIPTPISAIKHDDIRSLRQSHLLLYLRFDVSISFGISAAMLLFLFWATSSIAVWFVIQNIQQHLSAIVSALQQLFLLLYLQFTILATLGENYDSLYCYLFHNAMTTWMFSNPLYK